MLRRWAEDGRISWSDYAKALQGVRIEAELFLAERLMHAEGGGDQEVEGHPLGDAGGHIPETSIPRSHVRRKVSIKKGVDRHGFPIDQTQVSYEGGEDLDEVAA